MTTTQRLTYISWRRTTGITDVKVTVYNASNSVVVNAGTMTELANGIYYYDYTPTSSGTFIWYADSATYPAPLSGSFVSDYTTTTTATTSTGDIANTQELARFCNLEGVVPDPTIVGESRLMETIGTADNATTKFYLDNSGAIAGTYTLYYGPSEGSTTALTESTHYTLDKDLGKVTLTGTAVTVIGTAAIYGAYSYVKLSHGVRLNDTQLQEALDMAENYFEQATNNKFVDGTVTTPSWGTISNENLEGQGKYNRDYYLQNYPIPSVSTTIGTAVVASDTTIYVNSTEGFPSSGTIGIENDKITYTGKTTNTFTGCSGVSSAHTVDKNVKPYVIEISTSDSGSEPTWQALDEDSEFDLDLDTGRVHLYIDNITLDAVSTSYPQKNLPNRFRATYIYGNDSIPDEVKMCVLMLAAKNLSNMAGRRTGIDGIKRDTTLNNVDQEWIDKIIAQNTHQQVDNI
jgi:hypothetical protein